MQEISVRVLKILLADTFSLYVKTLNYHWNIRNTNEFYEIHTLLEVQYRSLAEGIDVIAETISMHDEFAPGTFSEFQELTSIQEGVSTNPSHEMLQELAEDNLTIVRFIEERQSEVNFITNDLLADRAREHSKAAWMLKASLGKLCR